MTLQEAVDEAVTAAELPPCCEQDGWPWRTRDFLSGRVRRFDCSCPQGHDFVIRAFAPSGTRWST